MCASFLNTREIFLKTTNFNFNNRNFALKFWDSTDGPIGKVFALDTETDIIVEGEVANLVLASAYSGEDTTWIIRKNDIKYFIDVHKSSSIVMCNAAFDLLVLEKEIGDELFHFLDSQHLLDISLLYQLVILATEGRPPWSHSLATMTEKYLGIILDKEGADLSGKTIRTNFGSYLRDGVVAYDEISCEAYVYAAIDSIATWEIYTKILPLARKCSIGRSLLTHDTQIKAAYALAKVEKTGCFIDKTKVTSLSTEIEMQLLKLNQYLLDDGWSSGSGSKTRYEQKIIELENEYQFRLPRTKTGKPTSAEYYLEEHSEIPFIKNYLEYHSLRKLNSTFVSKLRDKAIVYPHFRVLVSTGRTSSYNPNFQNFPRDGLIRECFIPRSEHIYVIADYSTVELCTLAQTCINRFGSSKMAELINSGVDLHSWFAGKILSKPIEEISKTERLYAKACNFGFPGGLGVKQFLSYAKSTYGIGDLSFQRAKELKELWLSSFPEMKKYLEAEKGSFFGSLTTAKTITGRIRTNCTYTQSKNFPFQGLAADGSKLALYRLIRENFRVVNYIHDEFVVEIQKDSQMENKMKTIVKIMIDEMNVVCPQVSIRVESALAPCWRKC